MLRAFKIMIMAILTLLQGVILGQSAGATLKPDKSSIVIGDQFTTELTVTAPAGSIVHWPMLTDTLAQNIEILRKSGIDTVSSDRETYTLKQILTVTSFDSGYYEIKPISVKYTRKGDTASYYANTVPVAINVQTVQVDQNADIKPIKPPLKAPVSFRELLPWIVLALALIGLGVFIYYYRKRRKQVKPVITTRLNASMPPHEAALEALEQLRLKKLWQSGRLKDYYSEMTDIVREYIELRYPVRAMEMTTGEILDSLRKTDVNGTAREKLNQVLVLADLVKFAKEQPLPLENDQSLTQCVEFVRETRPIKEPLQSSEVPGIVEQNRTT